MPDEVEDRLGPDHDCRRDDPGYATVGEWWEAHRGRVPIQAAAALDQLVKTRGMSFADAFRALVDSRAMVFVDEPQRRASRRAKRREG